MQDIYRAEYDVLDNCVVKPILANNFTFTTSAITSYVVLRVIISDPESYTKRSSFIKKSAYLNGLGLPNGKKLSDEFTTPFIKKAPGKNIISTNNYILDSSINSTGGLSSSGNGSVVSEIFPIKPTTSFIVSAVFTLKIVLFNSDYILTRTLNLYTGDGHDTFTTTEDEVLCRVMWAGVVDIGRNMIQEGTLRTFYEDPQLEIDEPIATDRVLEKIPAMKNEFSIPSTFYLAKGIKNTIYLPNLMKRFRPYDHYIRMNGLLNWDDRATITPTTDFTNTVEMYDADFNMMKKKTVNYKVGDMAKDTGPLNVLLLGDSFTDIATYPKQIIDSWPNVSLIGTKYNSGHGQFTEGGSGWTLNQFAELIHSPVEWAGFSPFLQPIDPYKYYGDTKTWISCYANEPYTKLLRQKGDLIGINGTTGYLSAPDVNDVIYDNALSLYKVWNGTQWATIAEATLAFTINITKYRTVWLVPKIDIFTIHIGTNDFSRLTAGTILNEQILIDLERSGTYMLPEFKTQMDAFYDSYLDDNPAGKFMIVIPNSRRGGMKNKGGEFTNFINAKMYEGRKFVVDNYQGREAESIYLVDAGSCVDPELGFTTYEVVPFPEYTGTKTITVIDDNTHPNGTGFLQIGTRIASAIQYIR